MSQWLTNNIRIILSPSSSLPLLTKSYAPCSAVSADSLTFDIPRCVLRSVSNLTIYDNFFYLSNCFLFCIFTVIICTVLATSRCKHYLCWLIDQLLCNLIHYSLTKTSFLLGYLRLFSFAVNLFFEAASDIEKQGNVGRILNLVIHRGVRRGRWWGVKTPLSWGLVLNCDRSIVKHALQNTQNVCYQWLSNSYKVHRIRFRPGLCPDHAGGAYSTPQIP